MTVNLFSPATDFSDPFEAPVRIRLRDGSEALLRQATPDDAAQVAAFLEGLSPESRRLRFFTVSAPFDKITSGIGRPGRLDLVVTCSPDDEVVGHAILSITGPARAEVAFAVDESHRHLGIASAMLGRLAEYARNAGLTTFEAATLSNNTQMIQVFKECGLRPIFHRNHGRLDVELHLEKATEAS